MKATAAARILMTLLVGLGLSGAASAANMAPVQPAGDPSAANPFPIPRTCLSYSQVKARLKRSGYTSISRRYGTKANWVFWAMYAGGRYELVVNKCNAAIISGDRV